MYACIFARAYINPKRAYIHALGAYTYMRTCQYTYIHAKTGVFVHVSATEGHGFAFRGFFRERAAVPGTRAETAASKKAQSPETDCILTSALQ